jgi:hypothetical protein
VSASEGHRPGSAVDAASAPKPGTSRRSLVVFAIKVVVAAALIGWLVRSGALDFGALRILFRKPLLLALDLAVFSGGIVIATLRWRALLSIADVEVPLKRLFLLQLTAQFFNIVIPGNVGGDVVKALYVARDADKSKRTSILLIVFVERVIGLAGLVVMATLITALRGRVLWGDPLLRPLATTVALLGAGLVLGAVAFMVLMRVAGERMESWTSGTTAIAKLLNQLVAAFRLFSHGPSKLVVALVLSMAGHAFAMALFTALTHAISGQDVAYSAVATVFPLGLLTLVLPVSPAGLGVGHVAFDRLFSAIGLRGGATIYNVYLLGQIVPCFVGVVPYLSLRRHPQPTLEETDAGPSRVR